MAPHADGVAAVLRSGPDLGGGATLKAVEGEAVGVLRGLGIDVHPLPVVRDVVILSRARPLLGGLGAETVRGIAEAVIRPLILHGFGGLPTIAVGPPPGAAARSGGQGEHDDEHGDDEAASALARRGGQRRLVIDAGPVAREGGCGRLLGGLTGIAHRLRP